MRYRPDLMKSDDGFYFVGNVPASVGYAYLDGTPASDEVVTRELTLPIGMRSITHRFFETNKEAWEALRLASKKNRVIK